MRKLLLIAILGFALPAQTLAKEAQEPTNKGTKPAEAVAGKKSTADARKSIQQPVVKPARRVAVPVRKTAHRSVTVISDGSIAEPEGEYITIDDGAPVYDGSSSDSAWISDDAFSGSTCGDGIGIYDDCGTATCGDGDGCGTDGCDSGAGGGLGLGSAEDCYRYGSFWEIVHSGRRFWAETQAIGWYVKGQYLPALVTTSTAGTPQGQAGVLGEPNTSILVGGNRQDEEVRIGGRTNFGMWLTEAQSIGVAADYYILEEESSFFGLGSTGDPILARPFYNVELAQQDAAELAFPGFVDSFGQVLNLSGSVTVETHSRVQSAGVSLRKPTYVSFLGDYRVNLLGGYRFMRLDEGLRISDSVAPMGGFFVPGTTFDSFDNFDTENEFHGGEIGLMLEVRRCRWSFEFLTRVALGNMRQTVGIDGWSSINDTVNTVVTPGGLLTQPTNIGTFVGDEFTVIPEAGIKVGLQLTDSIKTSIGYNYIYVSNVVRPGGQVDTGVNISQIDGGALVGQPRPAPLTSDTDFWLQGGNVSLEVRF